MPVSPETLNAIQDYHTKLKVSNLSQPDSSTCQSTCIAMALDKKTKDDIDKIRNDLQKYGQAGDPKVMAKVIKADINLNHVPVNYQLYEHASLDEVKTWLEEGDFLITHGWFTHEGHVICLAGVEIDTENNHYKFNVKDPWREFDAPKWTYDLKGNFYDGYYSSYCIYAACVASKNCAEAKSIYTAKELDSSSKKMWVHRFMPKSATSSSQSASSSSTRSTSTSSSKSKTPSTLQQAFEPLFNLITQGEGSPNAMNQGTIGNQIVGSTLDSKTIIRVELTSLTLKELIERQAYEMNRNNPQKNHYGVFAAGKFQFIPSTLKNLVASSGIAESTLFDVNTQNSLCLELIRTSVSAAYRYVQGQSNDLDAAINELAKQWASFPTTSGRSAYGDGNAASHSVDSVRQALNEVRANLGQSGTATGGGGSSSKVYVVQQGDTLSGIANSFGVSLEALEKANPQIKDPNSIAVGERVHIPES